MTLDFCRIVYHSVAPPRDAGDQTFWEIFNRIDAAATALGLDPLIDNIRRIVFAHPETVTYFKTHRPAPHIDVTRRDNLVIDPAQLERPIRGRFHRDPVTRDRVHEDDYRVVRGRVLLNHFINVREQYIAHDYATHKALAYTNLGPITTVSPLYFMFFLLITTILPVSYLF